MFAIGAVIALVMSLFSISNPSEVRFGAFVMGGLGWLFEYLACSTYESIIMEERKYAKEKEAQYKDEKLEMNLEIRELNSKIKELKEELATKNNSIESLRKELKKIRESDPNYKAVYWE